MGEDHQEVKIWQWNCRGFRHKRENLQLHIQNLDNSEAPDVIALQENLSRVKLRNYKAYEIAGTQNPRVAVLVHRNLTAIEHKIDIVGVDCLLVEIIPQTRGSCSLFQLNVYSSPKEPHPPILEAISRTLRLCGTKPLIIVKDFNACNMSWGYRKNNKKGTALWNYIQDEGLSLLNDTLQPTRIGNSVQADTSPDLTLCKNIGHGKWKNTA